ncbi:MAG TPA: hypothetical protein VFV35_04285 [Acidimicrobiales bacterium]|nr:hypothetical protein [Acidimicrobiales bacterium]
MANDTKKPVDQILDLVVFAPIGLALTARDELPALVERGRRSMAGGALFVRIMGTHVLRESETELRRRTAPAEDAEGHREEPVLASVGAREGGTSSNGAAAAPHDGAGRAGPRGKPGAPKPTADHLAIPGYDTLSASQVVLRLAGLSADELEAVRAYEEATRGRRTILAKIGQLQSEA